MYFQFQNDLVSSISWRFWIFALWRISYISHVGYSICSHYLHVYHNITGCHYCCGWYTRKRGNNSHENIDQFSKISISSAKMCTWIQKSVYDFITLSPPLRKYKKFTVTPPPINYFTLRNIFFSPIFAFIGHLPH